MAFDSPPYAMDGTTQDAELFRRAFGTLLSPAGGIVTPGDLAVAQQTVPNMSVQIATGQVWVPGTSTATQGPYYSRNGAAVTQAINASDPSNPRIDTVGVQVVDVAYAGAAKTCAPFYVAGTPTPGATLVNLSGKGAVPASSLVLAYVLVPASATSIVTANILNAAPQSTTYASRGASNIATSETRSNTAYGTLTTPDQVTGIVLPANGLLEVSYAATWQESVAGAGNIAIFIGVNQLVVPSGSSAGPQTQAAAVQGGATPAINRPVVSCPLGLVTPEFSTAYTGDVTTGQAMAIVAGASTNVYFSLGGTVTAATASNVGGLGGPILIDNLPAGTYTVSVQYKASSGSITASNRRLRVRAVPFA